MKSLTLREEVVVLCVVRSHLLCVYPSVVMTNKSYEIQIGLYVEVL